LSNSRYWTVLGMWFRLVGLRRAWRSIPSPLTSGFHRSCFVVCR
jgi:hypothetical protein